MIKVWKRLKQLSAKLSLKRSRRPCLVQTSTGLSIVHGIGQSRQERIYRGVQYSTDVIERVALTIVCRDIFLEPTIKVILRVAHTGEIGDGRIFVSDVIDTWSIRTGENGDTVLRDKK